MTYNTFIQVKVHTDEGILALENISGLEISWRVANFTKTGFFEIPTRTVVNNYMQLFDNYNSLLFKKYDKVEVYAGYTTINNKYISKVFEGVISNITVMSDKKIARVELSDYMLLLKETYYTFALKDEDVSYLAEKITEDLNTQFAEIYGTFDFSSNFKCKIENFQSDSATGIAVFDKLRRVFKIDAHFENRKLVIGTNFNQEFVENQIDAEYVFTNNSNRFIRKLVADAKYGRTDMVYNFILSSENLERQLYKDNKTRVEVNVVDQNNKVTKASFGDQNAKTEVVTFFKSDHTDILDVMKSYFSSKKYDGYRDGSSFKAFGYPYVSFLSKIKLDMMPADDTLDFLHVIDTATYMCSGNTLTFSKSEGLKQEIEITNGYILESDKKLNNADTIKNIKKMFPVRRVTQKIGFKIIETPQNDAVYDNNIDTISADLKSKGFVSHALPAAENVPSKPNKLKKKLADESVFVEFLRKLYKINEGYNFTYRGSGQRLESNTTQTELVRIVTISENISTEKMVIRTANDFRRSGVINIDFIDNEIVMLTELKNINSLLLYEAADDKTPTSTGSVAFFKVSDTAKNFENIQRELKKNKSREGEIQKMIDDLETLKKNYLEEND